MGYGSITDWVLVFTVIGCTWFLRLEIRQLLTKSRKDTDEAVNFIDSRLLAITSLLEKIDDNTEQSARRLDKSREYEEPFSWEMGQIDEKEHQELQSDIKERNRLRRLAKEKGLEVLGTGYGIDDLQRVLDEGAREQERED
jgi:hypothetical protein